MSTIIVGGGLVGLCSALEFARSGEDVTIIEKTVLGSGAARGNAGEVCPDLATPVAKFSLIKSAVLQAYKRDSALHVDPLSIPAFSGFLFKILLNARKDKYAMNQRVLESIQDAARDDFLSLADSIGFPVSNHGYVSVFDSAEAAKVGLTETQERIRLSRTRHEFTDVLSPAELGELEPCIDKPGFGFIETGSLHVDPSAFVDALITELNKLGVSFVEGARVTGVDNSGIRSIVNTQVGDFHADTVIICAGAETAEITRSLGINIPIKPAKGYSFVFKGAAPTKRVLKFESVHAAMLPAGDNLRVAGTMEFDALADRFNPARINQITAGLTRYFNKERLEHRSREWVGARPVTPDGLPIIDRVPGQGSVFVAAGHNMLGLMLAPVTTSMLKDVVLNSDRSTTVHFSHDRFGR